MKDNYFSEKTNKSFRHVITYFNTSCITGCIKNSYYVLRKRKFRITYLNRTLMYPTNSQRYCVSVLYKKTIYAWCILINFANTFIKCRTVLYKIYISTGHLSVL